MHKTQIQELIMTDAFHEELRQLPGDVVSSSADGYKKQECHSRQERVFLQHVILEYCASCSATVASADGCNRNGMIQYGDSALHVLRQLLRDRCLVVRRRLTAKYFEDCCFAC